MPLFGTVSGAISSELALPFYLSRSDLQKKYRLNESQSSSGTSVSTSSSSCMHLY